MKNKKISYIAIVFLLVWIVVIFNFSSHTVDKSVGLSMKVGRAVSNTFVPEFKQLGKEEQDAFVEKIDFRIRKTAHFLEYMVLGVCWWFILFAFISKETIRLWVATGISGICAAVDEFHQLFVAGRTGRWQDVCIDTAGAFAGILVVCLTVKLLKNRKIMKLHQKTS